MAVDQSDLIIHKSLKEIHTHDELVELFYALPERHVEKLHIVKKLKKLRTESTDDEKRRIQKTLQHIQPEKSEQQPKI